MTTLNVVDANTGQIVSVDTDSPTGNLYVVDANTGELVSIDLSGPTGTLNIIDANTGDIVEVDYDNPVAVFHVSDPNTGEIIEIDLSNPTGTIFCIDANTGNFVEIDLSTAKFIFANGVSIPLAGDTTAPTVTITCAQSSPTGAATLNMTFTLSELSTDFTIASITVGNGSAGNFAGSGTSYTCDVTPTAAGTVTVEVLAGAFTDAAGNSNTASNQLSITVTLPFLDEFTRTNGDLANGWAYTAGKWTVASNRAVGTPGLGSELITNGDFASDTWWSKGTGWTIAAGVASKAPGTLSALNRGSALPLGFVQVTMTVLNFVAGTIRPFLWPDWGVAAKAANGTYTVAGRTVSTSAYFEADAAANLSVDNISAKAIPTADVFCTRDFLVANINISSPIIHVNDSINGLVMCLDSTSNPQNYIYAYLDLAFDRIAMYKCVGGVHTQLIHSGITYVADRILRIAKNGTTVKLFYNEIQIGADQTVSDVGVKDNTRHGMFSTSGNNSMASFSANPT
jgi:hypothetical protein